MHFLLYIFDLRVVCVLSARDLREALHVRTVPMLPRGWSRARGSFLYTSLGEALLELVRDLLRQKPQKRLPMAPRVFVYPPLADTIPCTNSRHDKDMHETQMAKFFETSPLRTESPEKATIFYSPACLTDFYFRVRNRPNASKLLRSAEDALLAQIDVVGFGHRPHVLNALRCWGMGRAGRADERNHIVAAYPRLWASRRFARFCTEAIHPVDDSMAIHLPYCAATARAALESSRASLSHLLPFAPQKPRRRRSLRNRTTQVLFIGSHLMSRKHVLRGLHRQNISRTLVIINPFRRAAPGILWCDGVSFWIRTCATFCCSLLTSVCSNLNSGSPPPPQHALPRHLDVHPSEEPPMHRRQLERRPLADGSSSLHTLPDGRRTRLATRLFRPCARLDSACRRGDFAPAAGAMARLFSAHTL